jgi:hypothetical protein
MSKKLAKTSQKSEWSGEKTSGMSGWCLDETHGECIVEASTFICSCECHGEEEKDDEQTS